MTDHRPQTDQGRGKVGQALNTILAPQTGSVRTITFMNLAQGLERRLENLADGASASLFRGRMHPVAIATRLVRQLEFIATDTPAGPQVPNDLIVNMNPADIDPAVDRSQLTRELENAVTETSLEKGWRLLGTVAIHLRTDGETPRGIVECHGEVKHSALPPWCQLIADDGSAVLEISLNRTIIGRALDCDLRISNQEVSRHHCLIYREGDRTFLQDRDSSNGTFINGLRLTTRPEPVIVGDNVMLGNLSFTFRMVN